MKTKADILTKTTPQPIGIRSNYFNSWKCAEQELNHCY